MKISTTITIIAISTYFFSQVIFVFEKITIIAIFSMIFYIRYSTSLYHHPESTGGAMC